MADDRSDPLQTASEWLEAKQKIALATVTRTWGSAPRPAGSQMTVREDGAFSGSVSGGCVEGAVIGEAQGALQDGKPRNLSFGVSNEDAWAVGLACGGTIEINVTPMIGKAKVDTLRALLAARAEHRPAAFATDLQNGETRLVFPGEAGALAEGAAKALRYDQGVSIEAEGRKWFLAAFNPPLDLAIVGAVHIAQPLACMATLAGYAVRVVDPRTTFATPERFPEVRLSHQWPDEALTASPLTARSAVIALTHDPKLDDPALDAALRSPAFYIGALGSKTTHASRLERLKEHGFTPQQLSRIRGPIGLDIGARSPAEIAVAILAEMTAILRGAGAKAPTP